VLAAVLAVVALAVRQSLVLVRRAQTLLSADGRTAPAEALRLAAQEQAPAVIITVLATAAAFLPAAVMGGGAGLEALQQFAVALLAGLVTSTVVVLFLVPSLVAAAGGLRPVPLVGPDNPDGEPAGDGAGSQHNPKHARREADMTAPRVATVREGGTAMRIARRYGIASLCVAAGLGLAGCQAPAAGSQGSVTDSPATVEPGAEGEPATLRVAEEAIERLRLETSPVEGRSGELTAPYAAVVYDAEGETWAFVELEPGVYRRAAITVTSIDGDQAKLSEGPAPGTRVVTVGAAELVGVEAGISGGE
jgi:hypothetical protein